MRSRRCKGLWTMSLGLLGLVLVSGCQSQPAEPPKDTAPPATTAPATTPAPAPEPGTAPAAAPARERLVAPIRGTADLGYLAPRTKVEGDVVVTVFEVKNLSSGAIAGLKIDEFWWDRQNNPVTGDTARLKEPLQPGHTATLTLRTPRNPKMFRNTYQFTHAFGRVNTKQLRTFN